MPRPEDETTTSDTSTHPVIAIKTESCQPATAETLGLMLKLVDVLPPTIEKVILFTDHKCEGEIRRLCHDLAAENAKLPLLKEIAFVGYFVEADGCVERELEKVGVKVKWGKTDVFGLYRL